MANKTSESVAAPGGPEGFVPVFSGLLPHPPIAVPEVAGARLPDCRATVEACRGLAARLVARRPARLFLVSPHSPRHRRAFGVFEGERLRGDLSRFGAPGAAIDLPNDLEVCRRLLEPRGGEGPDDGGEIYGEVEVHGIPPAPLDHGAVVPLWFLAEAGWRGPTTVAALPWHLDAAACLAFGRRVGAILGQLDEPAALVASGDMSHRCLPSAPAGYHPRAVDFDRRLTELVSKGAFAAIPGIDPELRELAAEDASESTLIVAAAHRLEARAPEVLSYEHPFGVGYLVAVLHDGGADAEPA